MIINFLGAAYMYPLHLQIIGGQGWENSALSQIDHLLRALIRIIVHDYPPKESHRYCSGGVIIGKRIAEVIQKSISNFMNFKRQPISQA
jgi:hypothetical protein